MKVGAELTAAGQSVKRLPLPGAAIAINQLQHTRLEHEVAAVDPTAIAIRLFLEVVHLMAIEPKGAVAARRLHSRERGLPPLLAVVGH